MSGPKGVRSTDVGGTADVSAFMQIGRFVPFNFVQKQRFVPAQERESPGAQTSCGPGLGGGVAVGWVLRQSPPG